MAEFKDGKEREKKSENGEKQSLIKKKKNRPRFEVQYV